MKTNITNIVALIGFVLLVGFAYYLYTQQSATALNNSSSGIVNPVRSNEIVQRLSSIREISLNGNIFSDPEFRELQDFSQPITPSPVGKDNPFE